MASSQLSGFVIYNGPHIVSLYSHKAVNLDRTNEIPTHPIQLYKSFGHPLAINIRLGQ